MPRLLSTPAQRFAAVFGAVYFLVGVAGFAVTGLHPFAGPTHAKLLIFAVTPLHNIVHLVLAVAWLAAAAWPRAAAAVNVTNGVILGLVTVVGFTHAIGMLGMHDLGDPDNFLHLATATLALYFGSVGASPAHSAAEPAPGTLSG